MAHHNNHGRSKSYAPKVMITIPRVVLPEPKTIDISKNVSKFNNKCQLTNIGSGGGGGTNRRLFKGLSLTKRIRRRIRKIFRDCSTGHSYIRNEFRHGKKFRRFHHYDRYGYVMYVNHRGTISY